ncbi:MAG: metal ABC transporter permease, partial [Mycolicibacterium sp.]|nr:metal ABC transporter permease [Mycolicibacterium sp.]
MLAYPFMVNAVRAGAIVAVLAGVVGWMMVLRRESFAGHTLAVVGFPGAAAAAWLGVATGYGYFVACIAAAAAIAWWAPGTAADGGGGYTEQSAVIGTVQAVALATGLLFVSLYHGFLSGLINLLFGTIAAITISVEDMRAAIR